MQEIFFSLALYAKKHKVSNWSHPSQIKINNLTPDFSINNDSEIIEIYSPVLEIWLPISIGNVQEKSEKYRSYLQLKILIHIFVDRFINDDINSLKKVPLANKGHAIFLYHGENEIPI